MYASLIYHYCAGADKEREPGQLQLPERVLHGRDAQLQRTRTFQRHSTLPAHVTACLQVKYSYF